MTSRNTLINDVSDTSLWVAYYRAKESARPDALFSDPLAKVLIGERGKKIADDMKSIGRYTEWAVITRTVIIDGYIQSLIQEGIDTVINLGAGLDTRPYRMQLPKNLHWIEVDYPNIIAHKNNLLQSEVPQCQLTRVELDLADDKKRKKFLAQNGSQSKKALVLTEGVIPYLSEDQVAKLANELHDQSGISFWITEFFSPQVYPQLKRSLRSQKMKNAPFQFFPNDWMGFFEKRGWTIKKILYSGIEGSTLGRRPPMPWWAFVFIIFASSATREKFKKMTGYVIFQKLKNQLTN